MKQAAAHYAKISKLGGVARSKALSRQRRKAIAEKAAKARWAKNGAKP